MNAPSEDPEPISQRLARLRNEAGLSMKTVAGQIGVPVSTYRDWEYGRSIQGNPYTKLATVLKVSLYELLTGEQPNYVRVQELLQSTQHQLDLLKMELLPLL